MKGRLRKERLRNRPPRCPNRLSTYANRPSRHANRPSRSPRDPLPRTGRAVVAAGLGSGLVVGALLGLTDPVSRVSGYDWVRCLLIGAVRGGLVAAAGYVVAWPLIGPRVRSEVQHEPR